MDSLEIKLLDMLKLGKSMYEINKELGISNTEIYKILFEIKAKDKMYENIIFNNIVQYTNFYNLFGNNNIYLEVGDFHKLKFLIASDLHLGNHNDSVISAHLMYDYAVKNNINIIYNLGDFFEGYSRNRICKLGDCEKQISYALTNYPSDKSIITFLLFGNHDITLTLDKKIDIKKIIEDERKDIILTGIGRCKLYLNNFKFRLDHQTNRYPVAPAGRFANGFILKGHSHMYKIISNSTSISVHAPNLRNIVTSNNSCVFPSMLEMIIHKKDSKIKDVTINHLGILDNKVVKINESRLITNIIQNNIYLDREMAKEKVKKII